MNNKIIKGTITKIIIVGLLIVPFSVLIALPIAFILTQLGVNDKIAINIPSSIIVSVLLLVIIYYLSKSRSTLFSTIIPKKQDVITCLYWASIIIIIYIGSYSFTKFITSPIQPNLTGIFSSLSTSRFWLIISFILSVIICPFCEELFFRYGLYQKCRQRYGIIVSMLLVSVVFSVSHFSVDVLFKYFILSMILCFLYEKTGNFYVVFGIHMGRILGANWVAFVTKIQEKNKTQIQDLDNYSSTNTTHTPSRD